MNVPLLCELLTVAVVGPRGLTAGRMESASMTSASSTISRVPTFCRTVAHPK